MLTATPMDEAGRLAARRPALEARAAILRAVRRWFEGEGFLEVETPARVAAPGQEVHLEAIEATEPRRPRRWLITSPEYHMKRLAAAGFPRIVQIGKAWRGDERGPHHQPEFTIVEWYRADAPLEKIAADCEALVRVAVAAAAAAGWPTPAPALPSAFARTTVAALFQQHAGIAIDGGETVVQLAAKLRAVGVDAGSAQEWDDLFFQAFLDKIEPSLATAPPTFVFDWPAPLGALARRKASDSRLVERFELYAGGLELANAFGELTDAVEQRRRFVDEAAIRAARGRTVYPIDEQLLAALPRMPPTSGVALGFDRLVMFALSVAEIRDVLAFADDEA
jgi:lysyl-tRNA synthetase class 2